MLKKKQGSVSTTYGRGEKRQLDCVQVKNKLFFFLKSSF